MIRTANRQSRAALTLVELLAVMGILVIVMGAIVVAATNIFAPTKRKGTEAALSALMSALESYYSAYEGWYPPDSQGPAYVGTGNAETDDFHRNKNMTAALDAAGLLRLAMTDSFIRRDNEVDKDSLFYVIDAWQRPFRYYCPPIALANYGNKIPAGARYTLISLGEDGAMGPFPTADDPADDVKNFQELQ